MTVSTTTIKNSAAGNGSNKAFSYTFKAFVNTEVQVYVRTNATGAESLRTEGSGSTNYAVSGIGAASGGTITFVTAPTSAETVVIKRATSRTQGTDYVENDPFGAEDHETALDKLTHIVQEVQEEVDRSFKVSKTNTITTSEFVDDASTRASKLLGFSTNGNNLEATTGRVSSVSVSNVAVNGSGVSQAATASFTTASGALVLGIPVGSSGAQGPTGDIDDALTTRGDIVIRNASTSVRLAIGAANRVLISDGTDPAYGQVPLATAVSGQLPLANGGTGATSLGAAGLNLQGKQSIFVSAAAMRPTVTNGCAAIADAETTAARPDMQVLDFDASADEHAQFQIAMPKQWNEGTITFQVYWCSTATDTDGVSWALQGVACSDSDTIDVVYGTAIVVDDANLSAAEDLCVSAESGAVTIAGSPAVGDMCFFRVFRDVSDANDTAAEDARLIGVKIFITTDAGNDA